MENLIMVAAIGKNYELGFENRLIWKISEDLGFYKKLTLHQNIIMGRKTFESMPGKALEKRTPFILSSFPFDEIYDVNSFSDIKSLIKYIKMYKNETFIVVGGAQIYEELMPYADTMYITEIDDCANADTFFPYIDLHDWSVETIHNHEGNYSKTGDVSYVRNKYVRRRTR